VCRRQATRPIAELVATLHGYGLRLHGFGVSLRGLDLYRDFLVSADSLAWSAHARHQQAPSPNCTHRGHCGNCPNEALSWLLGKVMPRVHPVLRSLTINREGRGVQLPLVLETRSSDGVNGP
jgi:hypothetical protein